MVKLGFIGTGNMGGALAKAAARSDEEMGLLLANRTREKAAKLAEDLKKTAKHHTIKVCSTKQAAAEGQFIFLGVKPQMMSSLLSSIKPVLTKREGYFVLVTMAAGLTADSICEMVGGDYPVIRIMPNTPAAVGEGMILYHCNDKVTEEQIANFLDIMKEAGRFSEISESLIDAGSAVSGCGPAYAYMFAEAIADGGVACGLSRKAATEYACQMMIGAAKMILESGENPEKLKDDVCSPAGSTIQGVRKLEQGAFRGTVFEAIIAAYEKTKALG